jgi:hypothetical protein
MNNERLFKVLITELNLDYLKAEGELEESINSNLSISEKTIEIKTRLTNLVLIEHSITKLTTMMSNNEKSKTEQING